MPKRTGGCTRALTLVGILALSCIGLARAQTPPISSYSTVDLAQPGDRLVRVTPVLSIDEISGCVLNRVDRHSTRSLRGDTILVADRLLRRLSVLAPDGAFVRSIPIAPPADRLGCITRVLALADASTIVGFSEVTSMAPRAEAVFFGQQLFRYEPRGNLVGQLGRFTESEHFVQETPREFGGVAYRIWRLASALWGRRSAAVLLAEAVPRRSSVITTLMALSLLSIVYRFQFDL